MLKKKLGKKNDVSVELPPLTVDDEIIIEPEAILYTHSVKKGSHFVEEILVKWKHLPKKDATWENVQELWDSFINLNLEDKVLVKEEGIDKPRRSQRVSIRNPRYMSG